MSSTKPIILIIITSSICLPILTVYGQSCTKAGTRKRWCLYSSSNRTACPMNESLAVSRWTTPSSLVCLLKASGSGNSSFDGDQLVQWNSLTNACSMFDFQLGCRIFDFSSTMHASDNKTCWIFRSSPVQPVVSCKLLALGALLNPRLTGVWLAGSRFSNLVCRSGEQRLTTANILWTEEGASFNGISAYAKVEDPAFASIDTRAVGFTWLMRFKRQPRIQPLLETSDCSNVNTLGRHLWEYPNVGQVYYNAERGTTDNYKLHSNQGILPSDPNTWINIGLIIATNPSASRFFYDQGFVSNTVVQNGAAATVSCLKLYIGYRSSTSNYFQGVVQALAIANGTLTEAEIRQFFALLG